MTPALRSMAPKPGHLAAALAASALLLGPALAGCSGSSSPSSGTASDRSTSTLATTTTTASSTTGSSTTTPAPVGLPDQEAVVKRLYDAWFADDRATAATVADPAAVDAMWQTARGDYSLYNACSTGEFDTSGCLYRGNQGTIQFDLEKRGANWVVAGTFYSPG